MKYDHAVRYACTRCGFEKFLPEPIDDPSPRIRTGCQRCEAITPHTPTYRTYGVPS